MDTRLVFVRSEWLEIVLHAGDAALIPSYVLFELTFDDPLVIDIPRRKLPSQWRSSPPPAACQAIGDAWVSKGESAVLRIPSVVHPRLSSFLLNPAHADFARITRGKPEPISLDARLSR
jgi:RES domain-containing protein